MDAVLLTFEQSVDMTRERYLTMLAEVSEARKARQARTAPASRPARLAERALNWLVARLPDTRRSEPARAAGA
ncbi:MAG: hypothetical protein RMJ55_20185 [Roseiflexaceae bacterium]|nr:hypothetical protein [Roseiflexaceae bacterium]